MYIIRADSSHISEISAIGKSTFIAAHQTSGPEEDLTIYLNEKFSIDALTNEVNDPVNIYHLLMDGDKVAGYSKILFNSLTPTLPDNENACKLERLYISGDFYGKKLGYKLFDYNKQLAIDNGQSGFWLTVWVENERAIAFYEKLGFRIVGEILFKVHNTYNPNFVMWLGFED